MGYNAAKVKEYMGERLILGSQDKLSKRVTQLEQDPLKVELAFTQAQRILEYLAQSKAQKVDETLLAKHLLIDPAIFSVLKKSSGRYLFALLKDWSKTQWDTFFASWDEVGATLASGRFSAVNVKLQFATAIQNLETMREMSQIGPEEFEQAFLEQARKRKDLVVLTRQVIRELVAGHNHVEKFLQERNLSADECKAILAIWKVTLQELGVTEEAYSLLGEIDVIVRSKKK